MLSGVNGKGLHVFGKFGATQWKKLTQGTRRKNLTGSGAKERTFYGERLHSNSFSRMKRPEEEEQAVHHFRHEQVVQLFHGV